MALGARSASRPLSSRRDDKANALPRVRRYMNSETETSKPERRFSAAAGGPQSLRFVMPPACGI
jgi:hypothetical protein